MGRQNLVSFMLRTNPQGEKIMSNERVLAQLAAFVIAGSDSAAASLVHFIEVMSRHSLLRARVQKEIDAVFPGPPATGWVPQE